MHSFITSVGPGNLLEHYQTLWENSENHSSSSESLLEKWVRFLLKVIAHIFIWIPQIDWLSFEQSDMGFNKLKLVHQKSQKLYSYQRKWDLKTNSCSCQILFRERHQGPDSDLTCVNNKSFSWTQWSESDKVSIRLKSLTFCSCRVGINIKKVGKVTPRKPQDLG